IVEALPKDILTKMYAPPKSNLFTIVVSQLQEANGYLFGFPTRYSTASAQLWAKQILLGKPAGLFQYGSQEVTVFMSLPILADHVIIFIPFTYAYLHLSNSSKVIGVSAWGVGTIANGDGLHQPSENELTIFEAQGMSFAKVTTKLAAT
ncbi:hypothetical protein GGF37_005290, partial [Kickxella alabastrina]